MASIYGRDTYAIDNKGRLNIPASMRRDASGRKTQTRFFLKYGSEGCLQLYPPQEWQVMEDRLRKKLTKDRRSRSFVRAFLMDACWVTVDAQGRITIPPALKSRAGLVKDAVLHGNIELIEIWSPERFQVIEAAANAEVEQHEFDMLQEE